MDLVWDSIGYAELADGSVTACNIYQGFFVWNRRRCSIDIDEAETEPLIGTELLKGFEMNARFRPGGKVTIKPLQRR